MTEKELVERELEDIDRVCFKCKIVSQTECVKCFYFKRSSELLSRLEELKELKK